MNTFKLINVAMAIALLLAYSTFVHAMDDEKKEVLPPSIAVKKKTVKKKTSWAIVPYQAAHGQADPIEEHKCLVSPYQQHLRKALVRDRFNPNLFAVLCNGAPLGIFIFETVHTLPLDAIPPLHRGVIDAIAKTKGARLIGEISGEQTDSNSTKPDPRYLLTPEERAQYPEGWTSCLSLEMRGELARICPSISPDEVKPEVIYHMLTAYNDNLSLSFDSWGPKQLDHRIEEIFQAHGRSLRSLEAFSTRVEADLEVVLPRADNFSPARTNYALSTAIQETKRLTKKALQVSSLSQPISQLGDLDFADPISMNYLKGRYFTNGFFNPTVSLRNQQWWDGTIVPLLSERASAPTNQPFPPCLLMYGQGHNQGPASILDAITAHPGFHLCVLTREGWKPWSPEMQVIVSSPVRSSPVQDFEYYRNRFKNRLSDTELRLRADGRGRQPENPNFGKADIGPEEKPDEHGRSPEHYWYNASSPDSELPDPYDRWPEDPNYGNRLPDDQIPA